MDLESVVRLSDSAIFAVLSVGGILALTRPYWAFLFAIFLFIAVDARTLVHSRLSGLGEYFNLSDGCILICVVAAVTDGISRRQALRVPMLPVAMVAVLLLGYANSIFQFGYSYDALRALRWGLNLPILYSVGASILISEQRARQLFVVLLCGAILAEIQHLQLVTANLDIVAGNERQLRLLAFYQAHSESWLIAGPFIFAGRIRRPWLQFAAATLFLVAHVTHQTRSVVIASAFAVLFYYGWLIPGRVAERIRRLRPLIIVLATGLLVAIPLAGLSGFVEGYSERMDQLSSDYSDVDGTSGRSDALEIELQDWLDGNLLTGRGLGYMWSLHPTIGRTRIAWGHIGYATYLSQLGLLGFLVYGIWFPLHTLLRTRRTLLVGPWGDTTRHLLGFAGAVILYMIFVSTISGSLLGTDGLPGLLAGLVTAAYSGRLDSDANCFNGVVAATEGLAAPNLGPIGNVKGVSRIV